MSTDAKKKPSLFDSFLNGLEKASSKLPSPFTLFLLFFVITALVAFICDMTNVELFNASTGEMVRAQNFFTLNGLHWILSSFVTNFTGYAPLGLVVVMTFGIGMCEQTGFVNVLIRKSMANVPAKMVPFALAWIGIMGNIASDSASVILPPVGAMAFFGAGLNPIAGMICAYAGTNAGFSANMLIAGTDALTAGLTNNALAANLTSGFQVDVSCNWYFFFVSTIVLTFVIGFVDLWIVEPRLGKYTGKAVHENNPLTALELKGLRNTGLATLACIAVLLMGMFIKKGVLLSADGSITGSPFLNGLIPILFLLFFVIGFTYGKTVGMIKSERDVAALLTKAIATMASYLTFVLASSQFAALFNWTKLGTLLAIAGSNFLEAINFTGLPMMVCFILLVAMINLLISSNSAKWALLAPVFIPMFMKLGYHPAYIQCVYRIGDSSTNIMAPTSAYLFMMLNMAQEKYDDDATLGTFLSNLFPHSSIILVVWTIMLIIWTLLGLPLGPGNSFIYLKDSPIPII